MGGELKGLAVTEPGAVATGSYIQPAIDMS
jgi:hypothetical protein